MPDAPNRSNFVLVPGGTLGADRALVLFDGVCNLCNGSVQFVIDRDPGNFQFAALQSAAAGQALALCGRGSDSLDSIVLIENGRCYTRSSAALRIARRLSGVWPVLYMCVAIPRVIRDALYEAVARNRYRWFGRTDVCRIPTAQLRARFLDDPAEELREG